MTKILPFATLIAALICALAAPLSAAPKNPPLPPLRPSFPSDPPPAPLDAGEQTPEARQGETTEQVQAPVVEPAPPAQPEAPSAPPSLAAVAPPASLTPTTPFLPGDTPAGFEKAEQAGLADLMRKYAARHGVPLELLHRIIMRESQYHPQLVHRRFFGLMQIAPGTAHAMGYHGAPKGLLDPETNLAYATPYLANAWALADGDQNRAVRLYASGYYNTAKSRGMLDQMRNADSPPVVMPPQAEPPPPPPPQPKGFFESLFGG